MRTKIVDKSSGMWLKNAIHGSFSGENAAAMRKLFKLESDGITMAEITLEEFVAAAVNLTPDQLQLAFSYFIMINDKFNVHTVEFAREKDNLVKKFHGYERGIDVGSAGENKRTPGGGSHSVIIYDFSSFYGNQGYAPLGGLGYLPKNIKPSLGQILAHELLGHGNGIGGGNFDAVNMENLYLRAQGLNYYRTGEGHGSKGLGPMSGGRLTEAQATKNLPVWARIPTTLTNRIHKPSTFDFNSSLLRVIHPMDGVDIHKRTGN